MRSRDRVRSMAVMEVVDFGKVLLLGSVEVGQGRLYDHKKHGARVGRRSVTSHTDFGHDGTFEIVRNGRSLPGSRCGLVVILLTSCCKSSICPSSVSN